MPKPWLRGFPEPSGGDFFARQGRTYTVSETTRLVKRFFNRCPRGCRWRRYEAGLVPSDTDLIHYNSRGHRWAIQRDDGVLKISFLESIDPDRWREMQQFESRLRKTPFDDSAPKLTRFQVNGTIEYSDHSVGELGRITIVRTDTDAFKGCFEFSTSICDLETAEELQ